MHFHLIVLLEFRNVTFQSWFSTSEFIAIYIAIYLNVSTQSDLDLEIRSLRTQ